MNHTIDFYKQGTGDVLVDPDNYPDAIKLYLVEEKLLLLHSCPRFETIVEAGCTTGHYADAIIQSGEKYLGVDIARHRIDRAKGKFKDHANCRFVCDDIANLEKIFTKLALSTQSTLIIFPFNAFGSLLQPHKTLEFLGRTGIKFIISTYKTDPETQKTRTEYYLNCGFENLTCNYNEDGVGFFNGSGLNTIAYNERWFQDLNQQYALPLKTIPLGEIGVAYMNF